MTIGFAGGLLLGCKPLPAAGAYAHRYLRHLQICPTAANAAGYFSLPCAKGGGTAYAVPQGRHTVISQTIPQSPSAPFSLTQGSLRCGGNNHRQKSLLNRLVSRQFSGDKKGSVEYSLPSLNILYRRTADPPQAGAKNRTQYKAGKEYYYGHWVSAAGRGGIGGA